MVFLDSVLQDTDEFRVLDKTLKQKSPCAVFGVSGIHKANIISSLCHFQNVRAFCVAENEAQAQTLCNDLSVMGLIEVLAHAKTLKHRIKQTIDTIISEKPAKI